MYFASMLHGGRHPPLIVPSPNVCSHTVEHFRLPSLAFLFLSWTLFEISPIYIVHPLFVILSTFVTLRFHSCDMQLLFLYLLCHPWPALVYNFPLTFDLAISYIDQMLQQRTIFQCHYFNYLSIFLELWFTRHSFD